MLELEMLVELTNRIKKLEAEVAALKGTPSTTASTTTSQTSDTWKVKVTKKDGSDERIFETGILKTVSIFDIDCYMCYDEVRVTYDGKRKTLGTTPIPYAYTTELI